MRILTILIITLCSCNNSQFEKGYHRLDFGSFSVETLDSWKKVEEQIPYDSYVGRIAVDETDTIYFDLGRYSNSLTEYMKMNTGDSALYYLKDDTPNKISVGDSIAIDSLVKSKFKWDMVDHRKAKIVFPKKTGMGITGVYIAGLWKLGDEFFNLCLYGINLKPETEKALLTSINSLKFLEKR